MIMVLHTQLLGMAAVASLARSDTPAPNILMILTDDQGWGDLESVD
jgi:hypothetical protein